MSKSIVGAIVVLAILAGVWLATDTSPYTGDSQKVSSEFAAFIETDFGPASKISISKGKGTVELEKKNGQWVVVSSYGYPADEEKIEKILTALNGLRAGEEIGTATASHERFEVDKEKGAFVRVSDASGKPLGTVVVGKNATGGGIGTTRTFMRFGDDVSTYKVETNLRSDAGLYPDDAEGKTFLQKDIVKLDDGMEVQTVRITRPDRDDLLVERRFREVPVESTDADKAEGDDQENKEPETKQEEYYVVTSGNETFDVGSSEEWSARGILNRGKTISIEDAAEPKDLADYGLDSPQLVARVEYRKKDDTNDPLKSYALSFGNAKKDEEGKDEGYYFTIDDQVHSGQIFTIRTYGFDGWNKEAKDFLPKPEEEEADDEEAEVEEAEDEEPEVEEPEDEEPEDEEPEDEEAEDEEPEDEEPEDEEPEDEEPEDEDEEAAEPDKEESE